MKKHHMTHEQHLENADDMAKVEYYLKRISDRCLNAYPATHKINKTLEKISYAASSINLLTRLKGALDTEYHKVTSDQQFRTHGHVYYHLEERFNIPN